MSSYNQFDQTNSDNNNVEGIPDFDPADDEEKLLNVRSAARELGISYSTLKRWIYRKKIQSIKDKYGHHKISLT